MRNHFWISLAGLFCALTISAPEAFATIARMAVLGSQPSFGAASVTDPLRRTIVNGSLWYNDDYNVFYNPAMISTYAPSLVVNKGAEGGWFFKLGESLTGGVYVNRGSGTAGYDSVTGIVNPGIANTISLGTMNGFSTQRPIDLFFGGDFGVKWGIMVTNAFNRDETTASVASPSAGNNARYWHVNLGVQVIGFEVFGGATLFSIYEGATSTANATERLYEYNGGLRANLETITGYIAYNYSLQDAGTNVRSSVIGGGVSHDTKVTDGVHFLKNIGFYYNVGNDDRPVAPGGTYAQYVLPLNLALEADAFSWLTLRMGGGYDVVNFSNFSQLGGSGGPSSKGFSSTGTQSFRIGSSVKVGRLNLDSAFGNGDAPAGSAAPGGLDSRSVGFDSQFFALVAARYRL